MNHTFYYCVDDICYRKSDIAKFILTGPIPLSTYMRIYKKGDIVDIKVRFFP